ncbi:MAG: hypothetical protein NVS4B8_14990 [Herpetosiphon sp.]
MAKHRPGCAALALITPQAAGHNLASMANVADLVAFETYLPDLSAHGRISIDPKEALLLVDAFLQGILEHRSPGDTLVVTSDHGNIEDMTTTVHTTNPVPLIAIGPAAAAFGTVVSIDGVMDALLAAL